MSTIVNSNLCILGTYSPNICTVGQATGDITYTSFVAVTILVAILRGILQYCRKSRKTTQVNTEGTEQITGSTRWKMFREYAAIALFVIPNRIRPGRWSWAAPLQQGYPNLYVMNLIGATGCLLCMLAFFLAVHWYMGNSWSWTPEMKENHKLVTNGIFRWARHPRYACFVWLVPFGFFATGNWLCSLGLLMMVLNFSIIQVPHEEAILLELFGDDYRAYQKRVGMFSPKCNSSSCRGRDDVSHNPTEEPAVDLENGNPE